MSECFQALVNGRVGVGAAVGDSSYRDCALSMLRAGFSVMPICNPHTSNSQPVSKLIPCLQHTPYSHRQTQETTAASIGADFDVVLGVGSVVVCSLQQHPSNSSDLLLTPTFTRLQICYRSTRSTLRVAAICVACVCLSLRSWDHPSRSSYDHTLLAKRMLPRFLPTYHQALRAFLSCSVRGYHLIRAPTSLFVP